METAAKAKGGSPPVSAKPLVKEKKKEGQQYPLLTPTTDSKSELQLACSLGYPSKWHVVRTISSIVDPSTCLPMQTFTDRIYAGKPSKGVDLYYNHSAAMTAAEKWFRHQEEHEDEEDGEEVEEMTGYEDGGGQMTRRKAKYQKDEAVEVYYQPEKEWFPAVVLKVKEYQDDIRYTVFYPDEDATQTNICEDEIRKTTPKKKKKKKKAEDKKLGTSDVSLEKKKGKQKNSALVTVEVSKQKKTGKKPATFVKKSAVAGKKSSTLQAPKKKKKKEAAEEAEVQLETEEENQDVEEAKEKEERKRKSDNRVKKKTSTMPPPSDAEHLALAAEIGLPDGWTAIARSNGCYIIRDPSRTHRFPSKKAAFQFLGVEVPASARKKRKKSPSSEGLRALPAAACIIEEGDPPWRTTGHDFLGRRVRWRTPVPATVSDGGEEETIMQMGTVTGWIADTDLDKAGEPGFVSEQTGKPAALFHVKFDDMGVGAKLRDILLDSQDLEEYELLECLVDEGEEEDEEGSGSNTSVHNDKFAELEISDEDSMPLSTLKKVKELREKSKIEGQKKRKSDKQKARK